tara:strand:+ start:118 stop:552 length:435 start_codon:yes stop_codon:yes gene_type:complete
MEIKKYKISELKFSEYNPRSLSNKQFEDLKSSLERFGFVDPVIINKNPDRFNVIIGGHQRTRVWNSLGKKNVPCVELNLDLEAERELNIRLNKNVGSWDFDTLANDFEYENLIDWGFEDKDLFYKIDDVEEEKKEKEKCECCGK